MAWKTFAEPSPRQAVAELVLASALWGLGFIGTRWALTGMGPLWTTSLRFIFAFTVAAPLLWRIRQPSHRRLFQLAMLPGFLLAATLILQTWGLQYTTVTKSSFITCLYTIFVPLLECWWLGAKLHRWHWALVALALTGMALICRLEWSQWNWGDGLTLACSVVAALHILRVEVVADEIHNALVFNSYQAFWAALLPTVLALFGDRFASPVPAIAWGGLAVLAIVSTQIAFLFQIRGQRVLPVALVSMLFLLESPFASLYAFFLFQERLSGWQWLGALLILVASATTTRLHRVPPPI